MKILARWTAFGLVLTGSCPALLATAAQARVIERLEASVNSGMILLSDVAHFRKTEKLRAQLDPLFAGTPVATQGPKATDEQITDFLIDEKLITQQFPVTDSEVEQEIVSIQSNNKIDRATLKAKLGQEGFTFEDYFELIRVSISKRNLIDRDIRTKVSVSDADIKNYYLGHFAKDSGTNRAYQIKLIHISERTYKTAAAAREAAGRALRAIREGESFEDVAKRVSDDATASSGGDVGTVTEDQISPAIRDQLRKLQIGQVSDVFGGPQGGYYLLKLVDVKTTESDRLDKAKDEIRAQLTAAEYQHQIALWLERQRQIAYIHRAGQSATTGLPAGR